MGAKSWPVVRHLLLDLLKYNDNSKNAFSDGSYLATIITCLGHALVIHTTNEFLQPDKVAKPYTVERQLDNAILSEAIQEVDRYMKMDRLVPSFHNVVTIAGLEVSGSLEESVSQH